MKSKTLPILLLILMSFQTTGCGTVFFGERRGQDGGKIDPNIVLLDGIGLLFFIVPGLVAFLVDFSSGAIYLPAGVDDGEGPFWGKRGVIDG